MIAVNTVGLGRNNSDTTLRGITGFTAAPQKGSHFAIIRRETPHSPSPLTLSLSLSHTHIPPLLLPQIIWSCHSDRSPLPEFDAMNAGTATFRSILDKPLKQLTEDDISQLTREDCRKFLKEKGSLLYIFRQISSFVLLLLHKFWHLETEHLLYFLKKLLVALFNNRVRNVMV